MNDQIKKPNTYTSEFRESSIKLALESDQPIAQTARDLGVNPNTNFILGINKYSKLKTAVARTVVLSHLQLSRFNHFRLRPIALFTLCLIFAITHAAPEFSTQRLASLPLS